MQEYIHFEDVFFTTAVTTVSRKMVKIGSTGMEPSGYSHPTDFNYTAHLVGESNSHLDESSS